MTRTTNPAEVEGISVVFIGSFNPRIFHPSWFAKQGLIQEEEAERAVNPEMVITADVAIFSIGWLRVQVQAERLEMATTQPPYYEALRDLIVGTFKVLRHTPIRMFGIHRMAHHRSADHEQWHTVGHALAPKQIWESVLHQPGLHSLVIQGKRDDGYVGAINVTVEPSIKVTPGIYFDVNDHYQSDLHEQPFTADRAIAVISERWNDSLEHARLIAEHVLSSTTRHET